jgi:uncharacterized protein (TIGR02246 family)
MPAYSPKELLDQVVEAFGNRSIEALLAVYEPGAPFVAQPGQRLTGSEVIRTALEAFFAIEPTFALDKGSVVEADDLALVHSNWTIDGIAPDGAPLTMTGSATDVLRRQPDGTWLFAIDNPWGPAAEDACW